MPLLFLLFFTPLQASEDLTHLVDIYNTGVSVIYTNTSDVLLRCQISSDPNPDLPFGSLAEKRNITIRGYLSYTYLRNPDTQIIYCERLIQEQDNATDTRLSD